MINVQQTHPTPRKYLELTQDVIVFGLCVMLFVSMAIKLFHLVLCGFILTLGTVLRLSGIRSLPIPRADIEKVERRAVSDRPAPISYE
jgi:hypothetical protein